MCACVIVLEFTKMLVSSEDSEQVTVIEVALKKLEKDLDRNVREFFVLPDSSHENSWSKSEADYNTVSEYIASK